MKRLIGVLVGAAVCAACCAGLFTGCGDGGTTSPEQGDISLNKKTLAAELSDRLDTEDYELRFTICDRSSTETVCRIVRSGKDGLVAMDSAEIYSEFYTVGGKKYMLLPVIKCYKKIGEESSFGNAFIKLGENDMLYNIEETENEITEIYKPSESSLRETYYFTFDKSTGAIKKAVTEDNGVLSVITRIESLDWRTETVALPDLDDWFDFSDDVLVSDVTALKVSYYTRGITPEMVEKAGYTYEQISKFDPDKIEEVSRELLEKNSQTESE